jgi:4-hydroxythreonine-4-phosphate dehydrogenase
MRIAVTAGEPAGIGPDLLVRAAQFAFDYELIAIGSRQTLQERAELLRLPLTLREFNSDSHSTSQRPGCLAVIDIPLAAAVVAGQLDPRNARHVLTMLDTACDGCRVGRFDAMVTAPVQKSVVADAGIAFSGHTEYLADRCGVDLPVMMLAAPGIRVALATTHLPLALVPNAINAPLLERILQILHTELRQKFGIDHPRLRVCGLNPHAGEGGHLGREEIDIIAPAVDACRARAIAVTGPWSADTVFNPDVRGETDCYLAMYHDQGLPVLKALGFGEAVNITLGLPIIRTSVDHGTALPLAGTGKADVSSLNAAIDMAATMVRRSCATATR